MNAVITHDDPSPDISKLLQSINSSSLKQEIIEVTAIGTSIPSMTELAVIGFDTEEPTGYFASMEIL